MRTGAAELHDRIVISVIERILNIVCCMSLLLVSLLVCVWLPAFLTHQSTCRLVTMLIFRFIVALACLITSPICDLTITFVWLVVVLSSLSMLIAPLGALLFRIYAICCTHLYEQHTHIWNTFTF